MLEQHGVPVTTTRPSKTQPLSDAEVRALLKEVETVLVAKGKKLVESPASKTALDALRGPTGSFRAPMVRVGSRLLVGFHPEALRTLVGI